MYGDGPDLFVLIYFAAAPHGSNACHQSNAIRIKTKPLPARLYKLFKYIGIKTKPLPARLYKLFKYIAIKTKPLPSQVIQVI